VIRPLSRGIGVALAVGVALALAIPSSPLPAAAEVAPDTPALNWVVNTAPGGPSEETLRAAIADAGGTFLISYPEIGVTVVRAPEGGFAAQLRDLPWVQSVGPTRTSTTPDRLPDPAESAAGVTEEPEAMPAEGTAWDTVAVGATTPGGAGVVVGVADNGIDAGHPDLADRIDPALSVGCGINGVPDTRPAAWAPEAGLSGAHGTHVAGSIAGAADGAGIRGIASDARVAAIKVDNQTGHIYPEASICATMWAVRHDIPVVNHSYYVDPWYVWCAGDETQSAALEALRRTYAYAHEQGVVSVAAVGNEAQDLATMTTDVVSPNDGAPEPRPVDSSCLKAPAGLPDVISVAAADQDETSGAVVMARFSNYGAGTVTVTAPGVVWSAVTRQDDGSIYALFPGTSMASPHVAGLAARLLAADPTLTPDEVTRRITATADGVADEGPDRMGAGLMDADIGASVPAVGVYSRVALTGQPFRVTGSGYPPRSRVELRVGTATMPVQTDGQGRFATVFPIPADAPAGVSTLTAGAARAPIVIRTSPAAPTILTPKAGTTVAATTTTISGTGVPGSRVRVHVRDGELTPFLRFVTVRDDGTWTVDAPLTQGTYEVVARTVMGTDTSATTAPIRFSVHTKSAIGYSVELSPQPGAAQDTLIVLDLANAGAVGGRAVVDIDLTAFADVEVPVPPVGEVERTARGLRWTLTLDSAQKAQLQIPATSGDDPAFPVIAVR